MFFLDWLDDMRWCVQAVDRTCLPFHLFFVVCMFGDLLSYHRLLQLTIAYYTDEESVKHVFKTPHTVFRIAFKWHKK